MLLGTQFHYFIPEVAQHASLATTNMQVASPPHDFHLEEMDLSCLGDVGGSSQAGPSQPSQYQAPSLPECHMNASYYRRRSRRPSQLERVDEGDERQC